MNIYLNKQIIGILNKSKNKFIVTHYGKSLLIEYISKELKIYNLNDYNNTFNNIEFSKNIDKLIPKLKKEFFEQTLTNINFFNLKIIVLGGLRKKYKEMIYNYLEGVYSEEYSSKGRGVKNIEVYTLDGLQIQNTYLLKAIQYIKQGRGVWIEKNHSLQLNHNIKGEILYKTSNFEDLYKLQSGKCNLCNNTFSIELFDIHHKYIPQCIKTINTQWNTELLCKNCHKKRHANKYSLINILINIYGIYKTFSNKYQK